MQTLKALVVVMLDIHLWSGRKKLRAEDLKVTGTLPPETLASLGSKRIIDPKKLAPFASLRKRAERACSAAGVRFLGGYAIPEDKLQSVLDDLQDIEAEAIKAKADLLSSYQDAIQEWIDANPGWEGIIRASVESPKRIDSQIQFSHQAFRIEPADTQPDSCANDGLEAKTRGLGDRLIFEASRDAKHLWEQSLAGKDKASHRTLRPLKALLDKLEGLTFLDSRIAPMVDRLESGLDSLPKKGAIEGNDFNTLCGLVLQISNPKNIQAGFTPAQSEDEEDIDVSAATSSEPASPSDVDEPRMRI